MRWLHKNSYPPATQRPAHCEPIRQSFAEQVAMAQAALASYFAPDNRLMADTLLRFAMYCQRLPSTPGNQMLWNAGLTEAIAAVDKYPPPPENIVMTAVNWRYLVFTRALLDQIETHLTGWQIVLLDDQGKELGDWIPITGPMTDVEGAYFYRVYRWREGRSGSSESATMAGLGNTLAGYLLPPKGLDISVEASRQGLSWADSKAFGRAGDGSATMVELVPPPATVIATKASSVWAPSRREAAPLRCASRPLGADMAQGCLAVT